MPASAPDGCLAGAVMRCQAPNDLSECPGPRQVRFNNACYACGETNTSGLNCRAGNNCSTNGAMAYTCH
jgi:hypothetical protein